MSKSKRSRPTPLPQNELAGVRLDTPATLAVLARVLYEQAVELERSEKIIARQASPKPLDADRHDALLRIQLRGEIAFARALPLVSSDLARKYRELRAPKNGNARIDPKRYDDAVVDLERLAAATHEEPPALTSMLDVTAVAARVGKSPATVRRWCTMKRTPCHNAQLIGEKWAIPERDMPVS